MARAIRPDGSTKEKTKPNKEKTKKVIMMKEMTKSLPESMNLPVEILVKIFNCLSNQDIRCGVSLACRNFYEICQEESLVPVKDLCIYGGDKTICYNLRLRDFEVLSDIMEKSKNLTSLKLYGLNLNTAKILVKSALNACPKLIQLLITEPKMPESEYCYKC